MGQVTYSMCNILQGHFYREQHTPIIMDALRLPVSTCVAGFYIEQQVVCGDFINLEDLPAHSLKGAYRDRIACVYTLG